MKKIGFTLAEVLVTLSIIGVVAAVTLPSINANARKAQIGPTLAKAVNTLENANRMALQENETTNLATAAKCIKEELGDATPSVEGGNYIDIFYKYVSGSHGDAGCRYRSKDGVIYDVEYNTTTGSSSLTNKYSNKAYEVTIDINGNKNPNTGGEDRFKVLVDQAGTVIPVGGREYAEYMDTDETSCTSSSYSENCTGNIADNGWKVLY